MRKPTPGWLLLFLIALAPGCQTPGIIGTAGTLAFRGVAPDEPAAPDFIPLPDPFAPSANEKLSAGSLLAGPPTLPQGQAPGTDAGLQGRLQIAQKEQGFLGDLSAKLTVQQVQPAQRWENPLLERNWQAENGWKCDVVGPAFVFGNVGASSQETAQADLKFTGRTGLGCKWTGQVGEVTLQGGPGVTCTDPLRPDHAQEVPDWQVQVQVKSPWLAGVGVQYQGTANPAVAPTDHDKLTQDVSLAIPLGETGKFQIGARHYWQANTDPKSGADSQEVYLGVQLAR